MKRRIRHVLRAAFTALFLAITATAQTKIDIAAPPGSENFGETVTALPNGNFVVTDSLYDAPGAADAGAVHLYNGATRTLIGSLTGSSATDRVGAFGIQILSNGNYVVMSPFWSNGANAEAGAATLCNPTTGCPGGSVTAANSLVGTNANDHVSIGGITPLSAGKYIVNSYEWNGRAGAVTFCQTAGCVGAVTTSNSLHGTNPFDEVGFSDIVVLSNGSYVVSSFLWGDLDYGAVTLCGGAAGCVGAVTPANSMTGVEPFDLVGSQSVFALPNGDFVVGSANWQNGPSNYVGAATLCSGTAGCPATISSANSLIGTSSGDSISSSGIIVLTDGNYLVLSYRWNNSRGAATWCSGASPGCTGAVSAANSLTGSQANNEVGFGANALPGGKYVVRSPNWDNGPVQNVGAVTFCANAAACTNQTVSSLNSLIGGSANDNIGNIGVMRLANGNYIVNSPNWDNGMIADVGASTFCNGTSGCTGALLAANSLIGTTAGDNVGMGGAVLTNGNYVVRSPNWDGAFVNTGAATFCSAAGSCAGMTVSAANSLVGSQANDNVAFGGIPSLANGNYLVLSRNWDNGAIADAGAVTYGNGVSGTFGTITATNSVLGAAANGGASQSFSFDTVNNQLIVGRPADDMVTIVAFAPTAASVMVSGRVSVGKRGLMNALVTITDSAGNSRTVNTGAFGYYRFDGIEVGQTYVVSVSSKRHQFNSHVVTVTEEISDLDFSAD